MKTLLIALGLTATLNPNFTTVKTTEVADYRHLVTEVTINATPAQVWNVLTDFENYPEWNPFIKEFKGNPATDKKVSVFIQPPGQKGMRFTPEIKVWEPNKHFAWKGKVMFKGIFDGEHHFELEALPNGTTKLIQHEYFSGILVPIMKKSLQNETKQGFEALNLAIKERAEKGL